LRLVIGARDELRDIRIAPEAATPLQPATEEDLIGLAVSSRPDLRAAELEIEAAGRRAGWERSKIFNMIAPALSSKEVGADGFKTGPAVSVELPIFDRNQGGISRAEAELRRATLRYMELADQVRYEVRDSRLRLLQAAEALSRVRDELLPVSRETQALAEKAHSAGDISYLDLQQARRPLLNALLAEESAVMDYRRAWAALERAVGRKL
jgi:cobalt-zinc-cadmium efflux system outer membrane protein